MLIYFQTNWVKLDNFFTAHLPPFHGAPACRCTVVENTQISSIQINDPAARLRALRSRPRGRERSWVVRAMWPSDSESHSKYFRWALETRLPVFVFTQRLSHPIIPLLKGEDPPPTVAPFGALPRSTRPTSSRGGRWFHVTRVTHVTPTPLPHPPTELQPPDRDSADCSWSRLMLRCDKFCPQLQECGQELQAGVPVPPACWALTCWPPPR